MPAIPKTQRCERCRKRKIKCDEKWPQCTPCKRSNAACSGPLVGIKFVVHAGQSTIHVVPPDRPSQQAASVDDERPLTYIGPDVAPTTSRHRAFSDFARPSSPRPYPTTTADRVAARLVTHLDKSPEPVREFLQMAGYLKLLPARLGDSTALRDCTALFASAWANFRRGLSVDQVTDPKLYSKALRSLRGALTNSHGCTCETLAAISVMERFEIMFDTSRPLYASSHRSGMIALMTVRGPSKSGDEMDVVLALENYLILAMHWLVRGGQNFYESEAWKGVMRDAIAHRISAPEMRKNAYYMELYTGDWASVAHEMRLVLDEPDATSKQARALALQHRAKNLMAEVELFGEPIIKKAHDQGDIIELPDPDCPVGTKYGFSGMDANRCLNRYAMIRIVLNRVLHSVETILYGQADPSLAVAHENLCRQIWMCLPYVRNASLMAAILFADPLYLSFEGARGAEKEYLLTAILEIAQYRKRVPRDRDTVERYVLDSALAMTGQIPFRERTDFPYWQKRKEVGGE